jgi:hypothetical protein
MIKKALLLMLFLMFISTNALAQDFIMGQMSGDEQAGIKVELYKSSCGGPDMFAGETTTNSAGYYFFDDLANGDYIVRPYDDDILNFFPEFRNVEIPQPEVSLIDEFQVVYQRFLDNNDGTVSDYVTGLIWLKNGNCYGMANWFDAMELPKSLNNGECGLSDGSVEGDWRAPTKSELQGLGTDPPIYWLSGNQSGLWFGPGFNCGQVCIAFMFDEIEGQANYWTSTWRSSDGFGWYMNLRTSHTWYEDRDLPNLKVWPVRSGN